MNRPLGTPTTVLTGFLGSGKTTLLNRLLPSMRRTAVIVNEFGAIALDHDLVTASEETVIDLDGGCACCTVRGDLIEALRDLHARRARGEVAFERVLIETTGLADPVPILHALMADPRMEHLFCLNGVLVTVDAACGAATLASHFEAGRQVAVADRLILTKADLVAPAEAETLRADLRARNPGATLLDADDAARDLASLLGPPHDLARRPDEVRRWLGDAAVEATAQEHEGHGHHGRRPDFDRHGPDIRAFCLRHAAPIETRVFETFLELLLGFLGPDLLRVKGLVKLAQDPERPLVFHAVQHMIHQPFELEEWPSSDTDTRIVFITRNVAARTVERLFDVVAAEAGDDTPPV